MESARDLQREFFSLLDDLFHEFTGTSSEQFAELDGFAGAMRKNASALAARGEQVFQSGIGTLIRFYETNRISLFNECQHLGGMKLVLGNL
jgi:hypothetical protein